MPRAAGGTGFFFCFRPAAPWGKRVEHKKSLGGTVWCHSTVPPALDRWTFFFWFPLSESPTPLILTGDRSSLWTTIDGHVFIHRTRTFIYDMPPRRVPLSRVCQEVSVGVCFFFLFCLWCLSIGRCGDVARPSRLVGGRTCRHSLKLLYSSAEQKEYH